MEKISYNLDKIIKIVVTDSKKADRYKYISRRRNFWGKIKQPCIKYCGNSYSYKIKIEELDKKFVLDNEIIYIKPTCKIYFQDHDEHTYICDTHEYALAQAKEIKNLSNNHYLEITEQ